MFEVWCDTTASQPGDLHAISGLLTHAPIHYVIASPGQLPLLSEIQLQQRIKIACLVQTVEELAQVVKQCNALVIQTLDLLPDAKNTGHPLVFKHLVTDSESLQQALQIMDRVDVLVVRFTDTTNIPLELLLARAQHGQVRIIKQVANEEEAIIARGVLESGPGGFLLEVANLTAASELADFVQHTQTRQMSLVEATVTSARHAGMGYRGCIDTSWLFKENEGMIVGSTSSGGLLVCAEVHYLPYMNLRPFRVNAGATHSYVWANDVTEYITDLRAGNSVLAVNTEGQAYPVQVGRVKIEKRPLRLIEAEANGVRINVFLQDDWHVRVFGADRLPKNCSTIQPGDRLLAYTCAPGRHVGIKVSEEIEEL